MSGPFSRTHEAALQARAVLSRHDAAHRADLGAQRRTSEDWASRPWARRNPWPWLLTVVVVVVFVEIVWFAYEEVNRLNAGGLVAQQELTSTVRIPGPKPLLKPLEILLAEAAPPPKPRFKPR